MSTQSEDRADDRLYDAQVFKLIMQRFDKVDEDNTAIKVSLDNHIIEDNKVHRVVEKHSTYWTLALAIGATILAAAGSVAAAYFR